MPLELLRADTPSDGVAPEAAPDPRVLVVASGKGGVGTSVIAALVAVTAAWDGARVLLVDADDQVGTQHRLFGVRPVRSIVALRTPATTADDVLIPMGEQFSLVAGGPSLGDGEPLATTDRRRILARVRDAFAGYDRIVIDAGSRLDVVAAACDAGVGRLLAVTAADRIALAANFALVKAVTQRAPHLQVAVVANRHEPGVGEQAGANLKEAARQFLHRALDFAGAVPDDSCLQAAIGAGMTIQDAADGSPAAQAVRALLPRLFVPLAAADAMSAAGALAAGAARARSALDALSLRRS